MDPKPSEQLPQQSAEQEPKPISLSKVLAKTLGAGLSQQIFTKERLSQINKNINELKEVAGDAKIDGGWLSRMSGDYDRITTFLTNLGSAKEVKLIPYKESNEIRWDFDFSPEKDIAVEPNLEELILDPTLTAKLITALEHNLYTKVISLKGFPELIEIDKNNQNALSKEAAKNIREISESMIEDIKKITPTERIEHRQLKFITSPEGITSISSIYPPKQQQ